MNPVLPGVVTRAVAHHSADGISFATIVSVALGAALAALAYHGLMSALSELYGEPGRGR